MTTRAKRRLRPQSKFSRDQLPDPEWFKDIPDIEFVKSIVPSFVTVTANGQEFDGFKNVIPTTQRGGIACFSLVADEAKRNSATWLLREFDMMLTHKAAKVEKDGPKVFELLWIDHYTLLFLIMFSKAGVRFVMETLPDNTTLSPALAGLSAQLEMDIPRGAPDKIQITQELLDSIKDKPGYIPVPRFAAEEVRKILHAINFTNFGIIEKAPEPVVRMDVPDVEEEAKDPLLVGKATAFNTS